MAGRRGDIARGRPHGRPFSFIEYFLIIDIRVKFDLYIKLKMSFIFLSTGKMGESGSPVGKSGI